MFEITKNILFPIFITCSFVLFNSILIKLVNGTGEGERKYFVWKRRIGSVSLAKETLLSLDEILDMQDIEEIDRMADFRFVDFGALGPELAIAGLGIALSTLLNSSNTSQGIGIVLSGQVVCLLIILTLTIIISHILPPNSKYRDVCSKLSFGIGLLCVVGAFFII